MSVIITLAICAVVALIWVKLDNRIMRYFVKKDLKKAVEENKSLTKEQRDALDWLIYTKLKPFSPLFSALTLRTTTFRDELIFNPLQLFQMKSVS